MATLIVNGMEITLDGIYSIKSLLDREGYVCGRVAVEKNGSIVPKARFETEPLADGDKLEIVAFVGGG